MYGQAIKATLCGARSMSMWVRTVSSAAIAFCAAAALLWAEPDWRSGKAIASRIERSDGKSMGIAGLWATCTLPGGDRIHSFTMLTLNADDHSFMRNFHKPEDEKRMVVILHESSYDDWLAATPTNRMSFIQQYPANKLVAKSKN